MHALSGEQVGREFCGASLQRTWFPVLSIFHFWGFVGIFLCETTFVDSFNMADMCHSQAHLFLFDTFCGTNNNA